MWILALVIFTVLVMLLVHHLTREKETLTIMRPTPVVHRPSDKSPPQHTIKQPKNNLVGVTLPLSYMQQFTSTFLGFPISINGVHNNYILDTGSAQITLPQQNATPSSTDLPVTIKYEGGGTSGFLTSQKEQTTFYGVRPLSYNVDLPIVKLDTGKAVSLFGLGTFGLFENTDGVANTIAPPIFHILPKGKRTFRIDLGQQPQITFGIPPPPTPSVPLVGRYRYIVPTGSGVYAMIDTGTPGYIAPTNFSQGSVNIGGVELPLNNLTANMDLSQYVTTLDLPVGSQFMIVGLESLRGYSLFFDLDNKRFYLSSVN